jgi:hypothetical protein
MAAKITDRELRLRALKLRNAYDQPNLILRPLEPTDRLVDIINIYKHEFFPAEKVYCSQCRGHRHGHGFTATVLTATGALIRMLLGSHCGADAFGEAWHVAEKRMNEHADRQYELLKLDRFKLMITPYRESLAGWHLPVARAVGRKSAFARKFGELYSRILKLTRLSRASSAYATSSSCGKAMISRSMCRSANCMAQPCWMTSIA